MKNTFTYIKFVYERISNSISCSIFVCIFNIISCSIFRAHGHGASRLLRVRLRRGAVSAPPPRGRIGKFLALQRNRCQIDKFNQIRSARLKSGSQRQLVQAARWSAMAILVGSSSRSNRGEETFQWRWNDERVSNQKPLLRNRSWCFLNQLHTEIQAQKINSNVYKVT